MVPGATTGQRTSFDLFNPQEPGNPFVRVKVTNTLRGEQPGDQPVWTLEKDSDPPSGSTVAPDTSITYTLTVTNRSVTTALPAGVVITDDLRDILDHARFVGVRGGHAGRAVLQGTRLVWTLPEVRPGRALKLRYTVHVDPDARGVTLRNSVTGVGDVAPSTTDCRQSVAPAVVAAKVSRCATSTIHHTSSPGLGPTEADQPGSGSSLPDTGAPRYLGWALFLGALLVMAGTSLLMLRRRRTRP